MSRRWTISAARKRFADLLRAAAEEPQPVFTRDRLVAGVVGADELREFRSWREKEKARSIAQAFAGLRRLCEQEGYRLEPSPRRDRSDAFSTTLDELPR